MTIRQYLESSGMSVIALAKKSGLSPSVVYRWLSGENEPRGRNLAKLIAGSEGQITANSVLGIRPRAMRSAG